MDSTTKSFALILIGIMAISCMSILTAKSVSAQTIHRPSVPEFTARLTASSLEVTIKNQPLTRFDDINVSNPSLYYGFRFKDPNSVPNNWEYVPIYFVGTSSYGTYYEASGSDYTIVSFSLDDYPFDGINHHTGISKNGPIDMQVIALIGIEIPTTEQNGTVYRFEGETSDWSNIQYITIPASSSQDRALDFIENVLPIDSTQWNIELKVEGNASDISRLDKYNISVRDDDKVLIYFLGSMVGTADAIDVNFVIRENQFIYGIIDIDNAPSYSVFGRPLEFANVSNFLTKYQSWSGLDSTEMIGMLSNVDIAQNTTLSSGNLTMTITRIDSTTKLSWMFSDSHKFEISFKNHFPTYFYDDRQIDNTPTPTSTPPTDRNPPHLEPI